MSSTASLKFITLRSSCVGMVLESSARKAKRALTYSSMSVPVMRNLRTTTSPLISANDRSPSV
eukprot:5427513-Heterocapsa_arctica.AAC.1